MVILEGAVSLQQGVGVSAYQRRGDLLSDLVFLQVVQKPGPPGVRGLVFQSAVQFGRVPHNFVDQQGVEVGVSNNHNLFAGRPQRRCGGDLGGIGTQLGAEIHETRQNYRAIAVAIGEDFPTPLVAGEVVKLEVSMFSGADGNGETLGLGKALVDVGAVGTEEQLPKQVGAGGRRGVYYPVALALERSATVHRHADGLRQRHQPGVDGKYRGDRVSNDGNRRQDG